MDYRYGSHTVFNIEYHFVWVTKYRYKVLTGDVATRVWELVRQIWEIFETRIIKGVVSKDHIPVLVSAPPTMAPIEIRKQTSRQTYQKQRLTLLKTQNNTCGLCGVSFWPRDPIDD